LWKSFTPKPTIEKIEIPENMHQKSINIENNVRRIDSSNIINQNLFGASEYKQNKTFAETARELQVLSNVKETSLNLKLKGIIHDAISSESVALISSSEEDAKVFKINDTVVQGTRLHSIYADRIILDNRNDLESLKLPKKEVPNSVTKVVDREIKTLNQFGAKLVDTISPTPYFTSGKQAGYRVYPGNNRKQFMSLGLMSGDLITSVNGMVLNDPQEAMMIFQDIEKESQVTLTITRNNESIELKINSDQFNEQT
jgi:general secretion pathway protein C